MSKHRKSRKYASLNRTLAVGAIAGTAAGFGVLSALVGPTAHADNECEESGAACGWFAGNNTNIPVGLVGNGQTVQFGAANGNIMNNQLNLGILSPMTAVGVQAPITAQTNAPVTTTAQTSALNGAALGTQLGAQTQAPVAAPIGTALGGTNAGANTGAAIPVNVGAVVPAQVVSQVPALDGQTNGDNINAGVGAIQAGETTGAEIEDNDDAEGGTNVQVAGSNAEATMDNDTSSSGGNTNQNTEVTNTTNQTTNNNQSVNAGNSANNNTSNNHSSNNGNGSTSSVG